MNGLAKDTRDEMSYIIVLNDALLAVTGCAVEKRLPETAWN
jgi:hypothetical protein